MGIRQTMQNGSKGVTRNFFRNFIERFSWLGDAEKDFRIGKQALQHLQYSVFGCGNRAYGSDFNRAGRSMNAALKRLGASRIVEMHVGDEERGNTSNQFSKWKAKVKSRPFYNSVICTASVQLPIKATFLQSGIRFRRNRIFKRGQKSFQNS